MDVLVAEIRQKAKDLLARKEVSKVLGFTRGNLPMVNRPFIARSPEEADLLWWDDFCVMNLAAFLPVNHAGKTGVIMKGCDLRSLVILSTEKKIDLANDLYIVGIPCYGMIDSEKVRRQVSADKPIELIKAGEKHIDIKVGGTSQSLARQDLIREACLTCIHSSHEIVDEWLTEPESVEPGMEKIGKSTQEIASGETDFFNNLFSDCIRCYACREACPSCYCETCFVDKANHLWQGPDVQMKKDGLDFHYFRAFHLLGRCTDCGACESACPVNIPVRNLVLYLKQGSDTFKEYEPGLNPAIAAPDACFCPAIHERRK